jgi:hypothetical protein
MGCCGSAEDGAVAARLDRRHVPRLEARRGVSNPIDAAMDGDQGAASQALLDGLGGNTRSLQLPPRHDPMRATSDRRDQLIRRGLAIFGLHSNPKSAGLRATRVDVREFGGMGVGYPGR